MAASNAPGPAGSLRADLTAGLSTSLRGLAIQPSHTPEPLAREVSHSEVGDDDFAVFGGVIYRGERLRALLLATINSTRTTQTAGKPERFTPPHCSILTSAGTTSQVTQTVSHSGTSSVATIIERSHVPLSLVPEPPSLLTLAALARSIRQSPSVTRHNNRSGVSSIETRIPSQSAGTASDQQGLANDTSSGDLSSIYGLYQESIVSSSPLRVTDNGRDVDSNPESESRPLPRDTN